MHIGLKGYGGESLLHSLFEIGKNPNFATDSPRTSECLKRAIRQGATIATSIVESPEIGYDYDHDNVEEVNQHDSFFMDLALEAAEMGDLGPFERLTWGVTPQWIFHYGQIYLDKGALSFADRLFTRGLKEWELKKYSGTPDGNVLASAAKTKLMLEQTKAADELYTKAIAVLKDPKPQYLADAALIKQRLEQYKESDGLYARVFKVAGNNPPPARVFARAGFTKQMLGQYKEAYGLYTEALSGYEKEGITPPEDMLKNMEEVKKHL